MDVEMNEQEMKQGLAARFKELPKVVQDSITSADVEKRRRELADTNKLHLDQWEILENDVMLTLLGVHRPEELADNLKKDLEISDEVARMLAADISKIVFEPIREELERSLEDPTVQKEEAGGIGEAMREHGGQVPGSRLQVPGAVIPATPPSAPPEGKAVRAPISELYTAQEPSHARKIIEGDPYREQVG